MALFFDNDMRFLKDTKTSAVEKAQMDSLPSLRNTCVWAGNIIQTMQLRKKILTLREIIDLPPCDDSGPILELIVGTVKDFKKLYPDVIPEFPANDKENVSFNQALLHFYITLRAMGSAWDKNQKRIPDLVGDTKDDSLENMKLEELGERLLAKLDGTINMAEKMLDAMDDEDEKNKDNRIQGWASGDTLNESYSDEKNICSSPVTIISALPEQKLLMEFGEIVEASRSHQLILHLPFQFLGQLRSTDIGQFTPSKSHPPSPNSISSMEQELVYDNQKSQSSSPTSYDTPRISKHASNVDKDSKCAAPSLLNARRDQTENCIPPNAPPPPLQSSNGSSSPPPPTNLLAKGSVPPPSPPVTQAAKSAPPPPPAPCVAKALRPKKTNTKLKKSSQMGTLYRLLKGKVEGSSLNKQGEQKSRIGGAVGGKQGMAEADALAEMARRSAYFQQIEADAQNYAKSITEVKAAIISFQTNNMIELANFHRYVEEQLEKLTDETQVLAKFEGFPSRKLETLRMAAALYAKVEGMTTTMENWKVDPPLGQLLQRVETYFTKIKREIDALERTKDEDSKRFQSHNIFFNFEILVRIKELMVDVSSNCMELALTEAKTSANTPRSNGNGQLASFQNLLWRTFQLAYQVYSFAGGQDERAERLTRELAMEIESIPCQD